MKCAWSALRDRFLPGAVTESAWQVEWQLGLIGWLPLVLWDQRHSFACDEPDREPTVAAMTRLFRVFALMITLLLAIAGLAVGASAQAVAFSDRDCGDFSSQAAAQNFFISAGGPGSDPHALDADGDGIACETLPCPCNFSTGGGGGGTPATLRQRARVIYVVDGDTVDVRLSSGAKRRVRMIGINAPEMSPRQCGAVSATRSARSILPRGTRVVLVSDPTQPRKDRYGRLLRYVMKGTVDVNHRQVNRGWARVFVVGREFKRVNRYRAAQQSARSAPRGIWRSC